MTKNFKTREVDKGLFANFLRKADENIVSAEKALRDKAYNAAAVSAIHSVISAADAYCVFGIGKRCASENHKDAAALIMDASHDKGINSRIRKLFDSVIRIKHMAEYEERLVKEKEAQRAVREAVELIELVKVELKEK